MRFFLCTLRLTVKRLFRRPGRLILLFLLPALCLPLALFYAAGESTLSFQVGVVADPEDAFAMAVWEGLGSQDSQLTFSFYSIETLPQVEEAVATGDLDCAFWLTPELSADAAMGRGRGSVILLRSPGSIAYPLARELLFASFYRECAPWMATDLIEQVLEVSSDEAKAFVEERFAYYQEADVFMEAEYHTWQGRGYQPDAASSPSSPAAGSRLLHGLIALFILAGIFYALPPLIREQKGILGRLSPPMSRRYLLGVAGALALQALPQGLLALLATAAVYPSALGGLWAELGWLVAYLIALSLAGSGLALLLPRGDLIYSGGVFLLLLTAALGGVALDLGEIGPTLGTLSRVFPSSGYISGAMGGAVDPIGMLGWGGLGLALMLSGGSKAVRK